MRTSWAPVVALLLLASGLAPARADAVYAVARPAKAEGELAIGTTTVVVAWDDKAQHLVIVPEVEGDLSRFTLLVPVKGPVRAKDLRVLTDVLPIGLVAATEARLEVDQDPNPCSAPGTSIPPVEPRRRFNERYAAADVKPRVLPVKSAAALKRWMRRARLSAEPEVVEQLGALLDAGHKVVAISYRLKEALDDGPTALPPVAIRGRYREAPTVPLQLTAAGADAPREILLLTLGRTRADPDSYRMLQLPSDRELPAFVEERWPRRYAEMSSRWLERHGGDRGALLEFSGLAPVMDLSAVGGRPGDFLTRWRLRVSANADALTLVSARDRSTFQSRFRARIPWAQPPSCDLGWSYLKDQRAALQEQAEAYELLFGVPADQSLEQLKEAYPVAWTNKPRPPRPPVKASELVITEAANDDGGVLGDWWKVVGGLAAFVFALITIGRLQRGR